jgi:ABC-type spermidine/putrescine transport system permease subunit I
MRPSLLRLSALALAAPPLLLLLAFFLLPLGYLLFVSFMTNSMSDLYATVPTVSNYTKILSDPFYLMIIERTLLSTSVVLISCFVIGYPVAYFSAGLSPRGRILMLMTLMVPLMVSNVVRAYGWVAILGRLGIVSRLMELAGVTNGPTTHLYDFTAVTLGLLTILLPFMIITLTNSLTTIDKRYLEAAESLGAPPWRSFLRVTLPLSSPGIASGLMLVTFLTLSAYVTTALLGGPRYKLLVSFVFDNVSSFRWPRAAAFSFILLGLALVIAVAIQLIVRPSRVQGRRR